MHQWMELRHLEDGVIVAASALATTAPYPLMPCLVQQPLMPADQRATASPVMHLVSGSCLSESFSFLIFEHRAPSRAHAANLPMD